MPSLNDYQGLRITVMGLGAFGGGEGVARFLAERGARVLATDLRAEADLAGPLERLADLGIAFRLGEHRAEDFADADMVVVNPAVKPDSPWLDIARKAGTRLDTEINIFLRHCPAPVVGITGSNGKSTTAALAFEILRRGKRRAWLGGNIGGSLLGELGNIRPEDAVVLELSSFQLERLPWGGVAPQVGVVLNVTPNHLDWHGTFAAYARAKRNLVAMQRPGGAAVLYMGDSLVAGWAVDCGGGAFPVVPGGNPEHGAGVEEREICLRREGRNARVSLEGFALPGDHHRADAACAAAAAWLMGAEADAIEDALAEFRPLPHRLETVAEIAGVRYVEDSVATTPEAAIAALASFEPPVYLIAGGSSKGTEFGDFGRAVAERAAAVALIGQTADEIEAAILACPWGKCEIIRAGSLREAFESLRRRVRPGATVLLSPACASFGMFLNYEDRAAQFRALVAEVAGS